MPRQDSSAPMTTEQASVLVFKSKAGDYFLVPRTTLEQGRVAEEHKAEVEQLIAEVKGDDVSGHFLDIADLILLDTGAARGLLRGLPPKQELPDIRFPR